jgi:hypothetical protein
MKQIKYRYGLNSENRIIDILTVDPMNRGDYRCISCGQTLSAVLGQKRTMHFRHKTVTKSCLEETYLHRLGKRLFYDTFNSRLEKKQPFEIIFTRPRECNFCQISVPCRIAPKQETIDLTQKFTRAYLEKLDNGFVPDILLQADSGEVMYVEIAVTHESSEDKISSGVELIEISIQNEEDLDQITSGRLIENTEKDSKIKFHNFKPIVNDFSIECLKQAAKRTFIEVYESCCKNGEPFKIFYNRPRECTACKTCAPCAIEPRKEPFDLTKRFKIVKSAETLNPEVLLQTGSGKRLRIIFTGPSDLIQDHFFSDDYGISIRLKNEKDLSLIKPQKISPKDKKVKFYNFNPEPAKDDFSSECDRPVHVFILDQKDGDARIKILTRIEYETQKVNENIYLEIVKNSSSEEYRHALEQSFKAGRNVINCFLCSHYDKILRWQGLTNYLIACKFKNTACYSYYATACESYERISLHKINRSE